MYLILIILKLDIDSKRVKRSLEILGVRAYNPLKNYYEITPAGISLLPKTSNKYMSLDQIINRS